MRLFVAVGLPTGVKYTIKQFLRPLVAKLPQIRWIKKENWHLTLKFIGSVNIDHSDICESIEKSLEGIKPFVLTTRDIGLFKNKQLIIWMGVEGNLVLDSLVKSLNRELGKIGIRADKKMYFPHITVGRGKRISSLQLKKVRSFVKKIEASFSCSFKISQVLLYQSELTSKGSVYKVCRKFPLL